MPTKRDPAESKSPPKFSRALPMRSSSGAKEPDRAPWRTRREGARQSGACARGKLLTRRSAAASLVQRAAILEAAAWLIALLDRSITAV